MMTWYEWIVVLTIYKSEEDKMSNVRCKNNYFARTSARYYELWSTACTISSVSPGISLRYFTLHQEFSFSIINSGGRGLRHKSVCLWCQVCATNKSSQDCPQSLLHPIPMPFWPLSYIALDFVSGCNHVTASNKSLILSVSAVPVYVKSHHSLCTAAEYTLLYKPRGIFPWLYYYLMYQ